MTNGFSPRLLRLLALALGLATASGIGFIILQLPFLRGPNSVHRLSRTATNNDPIGIWRDDPVFGWSHRPGCQGRHRANPDFDVVYSIDPEGHRDTGPPSDKPKIVVLGGSFTFGYGVEDNQSYPALLEQSLPGYDVINTGTMAWGTTHAWLKLQDILATKSDIRMVLYGFIEHHVKRNWLRKSWLAMLDEKQGRRNPFVEVENARPVFRGLADPERDGQPDSVETDRMEITITNHLLADLCRICGEPGIPLVVIRLPDGSSPLHPDPLLPALQTVEDQGAIIDLRPRLDAQAIRFVGNNHPTPEGHRKIAEEILPVVKKQLSLVGKDH